MSAGKRHVRVTIDGTAHPIGVTQESRLLRVFPTGGGASVLINPDDAAVTVEDVVPPRTWTDGDVVQVNATHRPYVAHRVDGEWRTTVGDRLEDRHLDMVLDPERAAHITGIVLRYQAGE